MKVIKRTGWIKRWNSKPEYYSRIRYMVIMNDGLRILSYPELNEESMKSEINKAKKSGQFIKPVNMRITTLEQIKISESSNLWSGSDEDKEHPVTYQEVNGTPDDYGLYIPKGYEDREIKHKVEKSDILSEEIFEKVKKSLKEVPFVIIGEDFSNLIPNTHPNMYIKRYCTKCGEITRYNQGMNHVECPKCGSRGYNSNTIIDEAFKKYRDNEFNKAYYSEMTYSNYSVKMQERVYFMTIVERGINLYKIKHEISTKNGVVYDKYVVEYSISHVIGGEMKAYRHLKKEKRECDPFEALGINTKNLRSPVSIVYDDAEDFFDFAQKNERILRMLGFMDVLKYASRSIQRLDAFFIAFIGILNKYPILEQLIKMGYSKLFFDLYQSLENCQNRGEIEVKVEELGQLVNNEATKGKDAMRFPLYIGDYLIKKNADISEYYYWRDLYELTNISKDNFETLICSFNYAYINSQIGMADMGNILKYGYDPEKLNNYLIKTFRKYGTYSLEHIKTQLEDYLSMCELMNVEADKFPQDLIKQHNDIAIAYARVSRSDYDNQLLYIGIACEKYFLKDNNDEKDKKGIPKILEDYVIKFPKSESDFIDEGNQQHNCVGSYPGKVRSGNSIIFFVRKKENPHKSFITAECTKSGLGQFYYSNNRYVQDEELRKLGKYICHKIRRGCNSGEIPGLGNVKK